MASSKASRLGEEYVWRIPDLDPSIKALTIMLPLQGLEVGIPDNLDPKSSPR